MGWPDELDELDKVTIIRHIGCRWFSYGAYANLANSNQLHAWHTYRRFGPKIVPLEFAVHYPSISQMYFRPYPNTIRMWRPSKKTRKNKIYDPPNLEFYRVVGTKSWSSPQLVLNHIVTPLSLHAFGGELSDVNWYFFIYDVKTSCNTIVPTIG